MKQVMQIIIIIGANHERKTKLITSNLEISHAVECFMTGGRQVSLQFKKAMNVFRKYEIFTSRGRGKPQKS